MSLALAILGLLSAEHKAWFDTQAQQMGNDGSALVLALSATGAPATHGWCAVSLSVEVEAQVQALLEENPDKGVDWTRYDMATQPDWPNARLTQLGLKRINIAII